MKYVFLVLKKLWYIHKSILIHDKGRALWTAESAFQVWLSKTIYPANKR